MYTLYTRKSMWEVEPRLYWRVKINNKWTWRKAVDVYTDCLTCSKYCMTSRPIPEVIESERM